MPAPSPKHKVDEQDPTYPSPVYRNWRRKRRAVVWTTIVTTVLILVTWNLVATWPDVRPGDTVRIKYEIWTANCTFIEGSNDLTIYIDMDSSPRVLFFEISHAKVGVQQDFTVAACPPGSIPCAGYDGFTSGPHAWQTIKGNVTVLEILSH